MFYKSKNRTIDIGFKELGIILFAGIVFFAPLFGYHPAEIVDLITHTPVFGEVISVNLYFPPEETIQEASVRATNDDNPSAFTCHQESCKTASEACEKPMRGKMKRST